MTKEVLERRREFLTTKQIWIDKFNTMLDELTKEGKTEYRVLLDSEDYFVQLDTITHEVNGVHYVLGSGVYSLGSTKRLRYENTDISIWGSGSTLKEALEQFIFNVWEVTDF